MGSWLGLLPSLGEGISAFKSQSPDFFFAFILPLLKLQEARVFDPENKVKMCLFHSQSVSQSKIEKLIEKQIENLLKRPMA